MFKKIRTLHARAIYRYESIHMSARLLWRHRGYIIRILIWAERLRDDFEQCDAQTHALFQVTDKDVYRAACEVSYAVSHHKRSIWTECGRP